MTDSYRHKGLRKQLAEEIARKGIKDSRVIEAISKVPRHFFLDTAFAEHAYENKAFPIGSGQTISHPYTVAFQTELLQIEEGRKVLEIGTGSGYQTAVLLNLRVKVWTIERQLELFKKTNLFFKKMGYRPKKIIFGDGYKGLPEQAPFDRIIVTAGAPEVPKALLSQLKVGGRLVIPIGFEEQIMTLFVRTTEKEFSKTEYGSFRFVPLLENKN